MIPYLLLLALCLTGWWAVNEKNSIKYISHYDKKMLKSIYLKVMFGIMFIMSAFRSFSVGTDTVGYNGHYYTVCDRGLDGFKLFDMEIGYDFLILICSVFNNPRSLVILTSAIMCYGYYRFIKKYSINVYFSTFLFISLYFFALTMNIQRQCIAMIFTCEFVMCLSKKKWKESFLWLFVAMLFHKTAFFMVALYPFLMLQEYLKKKYDFEKILIFILCGSFFIIDIGVKLIGIIIPKYQYYLNNDVHSQKMVNNVGLFYVLITFIAIVMLLSLYCDKKGIYREKRYIMIGRMTVFAAVYICLLFCISNNRIVGLIAVSVLFLININDKEKYQNLFYYMIMLTVYIIFLQSKMSIFARLIWYFFVFAIIYIPYITKKNKVLTILVIGFSSMYYLKLLLQNTVEIVPFSFF